MFRPPPRRVLFAFALALLAAGLTLCAAATASRATVDKKSGPGLWCGGTLWKLLTLSDDEQQSVNREPEQTTIAELAKLAGPKRITPERTTSFQRRTWSVHAVVDRYRVASNGEIILILYSIETAQYMNVYLPFPNCLGPRTRDRADMVAARQEFTSHCPPATSAWQLLGITVDVTGVGFWNPSRVTRGALQNGAELRPLTDFKIVAGCGV